MFFFNHVLINLSLCALVLWRLGAGCCCNCNGLPVFENLKSAEKKIYHKTKCTIVFYYSHSNGDPRTVPNKNADVLPCNGQRCSRRGGDNVTTVKCDWQNTWCTCSYAHTVKLCVATVCKLACLLFEKYCRVHKDLHKWSKTQGVILIIRSDPQYVLTLKISSRHSVVSQVSSFWKGTHDERASLKLQRFIRLLRCTNVEVGSVVGITPSVCVAHSGQNGRGCRT